MNFQTEYIKNGLTILDNFLPSNEYKEIVKLFHSSEFEEMNLVKNKRYRRWQKPIDKHFPTEDELYTNHFWSSAEIVNDDCYKEIFHKRIRPLFEELHDDIGLFRHQATKLKNNHKNHMRSHYDDYMGYTGYVLFCNELDWKYDWGGQLQIVSNDEIRTILPESNRLVLLNHSIKMPHWVTPVLEWAKEDRNNISGFCIKSTQELPKTWVGDRDDYAVY
jgi:hypothetical protein|tara:strand:+ start:2189 stop:2845 length:657 start_codon:yes stop_codon:yes gene_type:complete